MTDKRAALPSNAWRSMSLVVKESDDGHKKKMMMLIMKMMIKDLCDEWERNRRIPTFIHSFSHLSQIE